MIMISIVMIRIFIKEGAYFVIVGALINKLTKWINKLNHFEGSTFLIHG